MTAVTPNPHIPNLPIPPSKPSPDANKTTPISYAAPINLPIIPPELKPLQPYIQRATELRSKDPVMCYWCLYYAAKQGIAIKVRGKESRPFLFALMELLENLKKDLGPNQAVASDAAGCVYIQNFALKVFNMADNEDRSGGSTRSTAKKFLAAANFLELLQVFDSPDKTANEEKIRYAKWKAADIAKAFREGRSPQPGPAYNSSFPLSWTEPSPSPPNFPKDLPNGLDALSGKMSPSNGASSSTFSSIEPSPVPGANLPLPVSPEPPADPAEFLTSEPDPITPIPSPQRKSRLPLPPQDWTGDSPGAWSTRATPGADGPSRYYDAVAGCPSPFPKLEEREGTIRVRKGKSRRNLIFNDSPDNGRVKTVSEDEESGTDVERDGGDVDSKEEELRPDLRNRQDSWSSLLVNIGDGMTSRQDSWNLNSSNHHPGDEDDLPGIPEGRDEDIPAHHNSPKPLPMLPRIALLKKVHFSPSVTGGLTASNASTSPPREEFIDLPDPNTVPSLPPLPPSTGSTGESESDHTDTPIIGPLKVSTIPLPPVHTAPLPSPPQTHARTSSATLAPPGSTPHAPSSTLPNRSPGHSPQSSVSSLPVSSSSSPPSSYISSLGNSINSIPRSPKSSVTSLPSTIKDFDSRFSDVMSPTATVQSIPRSPKPVTSPLATITPPDSASRSPRTTVSSLPGSHNNPPRSPKPPTLPLPTHHQRSISQGSATLIPPALPVANFVAPPVLPSSLDPIQIADAQRHAKWAISALNFEDLKTARNELLDALAILEGKVPRSVSRANGHG